MFADKDEAPFHLWFGRSPIRAGHFRVFDFPSPDAHIDQRHETTIPQQGLFFLNHRFVATRAKALVARPFIARAESAEERMKGLYEACFQRAPKPAEATGGTEFHRCGGEGSCRAATQAAVTAWQYGWGAYDKETGKVKSFTPLPHFTGLRGRVARTGPIQLSAGRN
jgi:hypothetical protein